MRKFFEAAVDFVKREDGPTAVEYAVMLALIVVVCIGAITTLGTKANTTFTSAGTTLTSASKRKSTHSTGAPRAPFEAPTRRRRAERSILRPDVVTPPDGLSEQPRCAAG